MKRDLEKSTEEKDDIQSKIEELDLYNDSSKRELRKTVGSKQVRGGSDW